MPASLISEIVEALLVSAGRGVLKVLELEQAAEFVGAVVGLGFIVTGFTMWWLGH